MDVVYRYGDINREVTKNPAEYMNMIFMFGDLISYNKLANINET